MTASTYVFYTHTDKFVTLNVNAYLHVV